MRFPSIICIAVGLLAAIGCNDKPAYKDAGLPVEKRTKDLLKRMTLEEKIGQLICPYGWPMYERLSDTEVVYTDSYREFIDGQYGGMSPKKYGWDKGVVATLKHFVAYGAPQGGHNGYISVVGQRDMNENVLPTFKHCLDEGALSLMTSYNSIDGVPCTANKEILQGVVRGEWGFDGIVVSDLIAVDGLHGTHHIAADNAEAAEIALRAGVDVDLGANCYPLLKERVEKGLVSEKLIDQAVRRVLEVKFRLGLFDHPYVDADGAETVRSTTHTATALQVAREGTILLENNGILPLSKDKKVAVIGPNADRIYNQLGDYTAPQPEENIITPLEGIRAKIGDANVRYVRGCGIKDLENENIAQAAEAGNVSDMEAVLLTSVGPARTQTRCSPSSILVRQVAKPSPTYCSATTIRQEGCRFPSPMMSVNSPSITTSLSLTREITLTCRLHLFTASDMDSAIRLSHTMKSIVMKLVRTKSRLA